MGIRKTDWPNKNVEGKYIIIIDIDGTVAHTAYGPLENKSSKTDKELVEIWMAANILNGAVERINQWFDEGHYIAFWTARQEKFKDKTAEWLNKHKFKYHRLIMDKPMSGINKIFLVDDKNINAIKVPVNIGVKEARIE